MSATVANRRKVERYAQLLDESRGGPRHHSRSPIDDELSSLVAIGSDLNDMGAATRANVGGPSEQWKMETRARLIAKIERDGMGATEISQEKTVALPKDRKFAAARPGRTRIRVRGAILVGLAVGTLALSGMSAASGSAVPGDTLYGIKRSQEGAQLALATSDAGKGKLYLEFAATRLTEAKQVAGNAHLFSTTMADMDHQTQLGVSLLASDAVDHHSQASLDQIKNFVTSQDARIDALTNVVRKQDAEYTRTRLSRTVTDEGGLRADAVQNAFACKTIVVVSTDQWGPKPAASCQTGAPMQNGTPIGAEKSTTGKKQATSDGAALAASTAAKPTAANADSANSAGLLGDISHLLGGLLGH